MNPLLMVWDLQEVAVKPFTHFYKKILWFSKLQEAAANPLLMVWNLEEVAVKPFTYFYTEILMVLNFQEAAVKPFAQSSNEIFIC